MRNRSQTNRPTDRPTDRQTDRPTETQRVERPTFGAWNYIAQRCGEGNRRRALGEATSVDKERVENGSRVDFYCCQKVTFGSGQAAFDGNVLL